MSLVLPLAADLDKLSSLPSGQQGLEDQSVFGMRDLGPFSGAGRKDGRTGREQSYDDLSSVDQGLHKPGSIPSYGSARNPYSDRGHTRV
ncbi:hypothetical protein N7471_004701 [Penicillium samsonianum]|uniref:uncharacterized protein n=1 Tax=Penicillium samsonianum TaxID=1882272 RepID=UPI0025478E27|nr:uncharacterized protein N7471_004701 [Penicillium samsonianum]KAJ6138215.1 hypothetical protein N7471_004701 [Penicillium samsonianum]